MYVRIPTETLTHRHIQGCNGHHRWMLLDRRIKCASWRRMMHPQWRLDASPLSSRGVCTALTLSRFHMLLPGPSLCTRARAHTQTYIFSLSLSLALSLSLSMKFVYPSFYVHLHKNILV